VGCGNIASAAPLRSAFGPFVAHPDRKHDQSRVSCLAVLIVGCGCFVACGPCLCLCTHSLTLHACICMLLAAFFFNSLLGYERTRAQLSATPPGPGKRFTTLSLVGAAGLPRGPTIWVFPYSISYIIYIIDSDHMSRLTDFFSRAAARTCMQRAGPSLRYCSALRVPRPSRPPFRRLLCVV